MDSVLSRISAMPSAEFWSVLISEQSHLHELLGSRVQPRPQLGLWKVLPQQLCKQAHIKASGIPPSRIR